MIRMKIIERTWSEDGAALVRISRGDDLHKLPGS